MADLSHQLETKSLVMLVGPTAVGKSTIMNAVVAQNPEFKRALGFTTRSPRPNDEPGQYRYLTHEEIATMIADGQVLQHIVNPANGHIYGTAIDDYPGRYNLKDTLSGAVAEFEQLPFKSTHVISISVPPESWHTWLNQRYPEPSAERTKRLQEAKHSVEWSLQQTGGHTWLINHPDKESAVAAALIDLVRGNNPTRAIPDEPQKMLNLINDLLSYD